MEMAFIYYIGLSLSSQIRLCLYKSYAVSRLNFMRQKKRELISLQKLPTMQILMIPWVTEEKEKEV